MPARDVAAPEDFEEAQWKLAEVAQHLRSAQQTLSQDDQELAPFHGISSLHDAVAALTALVGDLVARIEQLERTGPR